MYATEEDINQALKDVSSFDILTKQDYNTNSRADNSICPSGAKCYETADLLVVYYAHVNNTTKKYTFYLDASWDSDAIPSVKSYDLLGFRWTSSNFVVDDYSGKQWSDGKEIPVEYSYNGTNTKKGSKGIGTSMNIVNATNSYLRLEIQMSGYFDGTPSGTFYSTYQHAKNSLTLAESQTYTFSSSGLGKIFYFSNSTIKSKYTNYTGLNISI